MKSTKKNLLEHIRDFKFGEFFGSMKNKKFFDIISLGLNKYISTSVLHGVYVGFAVLNVLLIILAILSYYNLSSMNSSIVYLTDRSMPIFDKANQVEIKLLNLTLDLDNVLYEKDPTKIDGDIKRLNASEKVFLDSINSFMSYGAGNPEIEARFSGLSKLASEYQTKNKEIIKKKQELLKISSKLFKDKANFVSWLNLFSAEEQNFKVKIWDDYVGNVFLNLTTYQKTLETTTNELLSFEKSSDIKKKMDFIKLRYSQFDEFYESMKREMPEIENELGQFFSNFKFNLLDEKGLINMYYKYVSESEQLDKTVNEIEKTIANVKTEIKGIQVVAENGMKDSTSKAKLIYTEALIGLVIAVILALTVAGIVAYTLSNSIKRPMRKIIDGLEKLSDGDMTTTVTVSQKNEFGKLAHKLNELALKVAEALVNIAKASNEVKGAASDNLNLANQTTHSLEQERNEVISVSSAMTEMQANSQKVASAASNSLNEVKTVEVIAQNSQEVMSEAIDTTEKLSELIKQTTSAIENVDSLSENIGKIINVIKGVADQTNLLALNAAIEAARAGEHGRGFAVVADEVRSLANTTSESANDIRQMISDLQSSVREAVSHVNLCLNEMEQTQDNSMKARDSIDEIKRAISKITDMSTMIAEAAGQQDKTTEMISANLQQISSLSDNNSSQMNQVTDICKNLDNLTTNQEVLISKFKLPNEKTLKAELAKHAKRNARKASLKSQEKLDAKEKGTKPNSVATKKETTKKV